MATIEAQIIAIMKNHSDDSMAEVTKIIIDQCRIPEVRARAYYSTMVRKGKAPGRVEPKGAGRVEPKVARVVKDDVSSGDSRFSPGNLSVLVIGECFALPFCVAGGEAFVNGRYSAAAIGFGIGLPLAIAAATFPVWRNKNRVAR